MRKLLFLFLICFTIIVFSCPTRFAYELLLDEVISFKDVNTSMGN